MATVNTYLLVSGVDDLEAVQKHSVIEEHDFDVQETREGDTDRIAGITFVHESPLEDRNDFTESARTLSADIPKAIVLICEVEERFDNIERLQTKMYHEGKDAGNIEHGYVFNIGSD